MKAVWFTSDRREGHARAPGALERLLRAKKWPAGPATAEQIHGCRVAVVSRRDAGRRFSKADGLVTREANQPLAIFTADCLPVFMTAPRAGAIGILHAGWRGIRAGILESAVRRMQSWGLSAGDIFIWTGPAIGRCCFEVRWDVARHFPGARRRMKDRWTVDLRAALRRQARTLGVKFRSRDAVQECTMHNRRYYSHRRDGTAERQVSVIMKGAQR